MSPFANRKSIASSLNKEIISWPTLTVRYRGRGIFQVEPWFHSPAVLSTTCWLLPGMASVPPGGPQAFNPRASSPHRSFFSSIHCQTTTVCRPFCTVTAFKLNHKGSLLGRRQPNQSCIKWLGRKNQKFEKLTTQRLTNLAIQKC